MLSSFMLPGLGEVFADDGDGVARHRSAIIRPRFVNAMTQINDARTVVANYRFHP